MLRETTRTVAGLTTRTVEGGSGAGVLLLHGLGASSYSWRLLLPELAKTRSVCAPDLPGFGRTDKPEGFDYSFAGFGAWVRALLDQLGWQKAVFVGNSMGGGISMRMAFDAPERVDRITLLGSPLYAKHLPPVLANLRRPLIGRLLEGFVGPWLVPPLARQCFVDHSIITPELVAEYSHALREPGGRRAVVQFMRNAVPPDADALIARYPELRIPILAIRGEHDGVVDRASTELFCRTAPCATFLHIPDCGHAPQEEKPRAVLDALLPFLDAR